MDTVNRTKKDKDHPFVMTDKRIVDNPIISTSATGLMNYLLSKPDGWKFCETDIGRHFSDGRKRIKAGLKELEKQKYLHRRRTKGKHGYYSGWEYEINEQPTEMPKWDVRERDNRKSDDRERGHILNTDCIKKECSKIDKNRERIKGVILKNQNNSTYFSPNFDYISVIKHYFTKYKERIGKEHPVLTIDRWEEVIDALPVIFDDDMSRSEDIDEEQLMTIINQHFNTEYRDCDYNILHFMAGDIRKNRFYEVVY